MKFSSSTPLSTLVQNFAALSSKQCSDDEKDKKMVDIQLGFIILLLSYYLYLLKQPLLEPQRINGTDGTFNITLRPYSFNIPGKIQMFEKTINNDLSETLFTVPAGKRYLLFSVMQFNTTGSSVTNTLSVSTPIFFKLDQTVINGNSSYTVNIALVFEEGESLFWQTLPSSAPPMTQIIKVFYVELETSKQIPLYSFKKIVGSSSLVSNLFQASNSGPAIIISGYNGFAFNNYFNTLTPASSNIFSCSSNSPSSPSSYNANVFIDGFKVLQAGSSLITNTSGLPSPSSASIHALNYGIVDRGFIIAPGSALQVGPVSGVNGIQVYGTYYQF
jgi:hypothetical protein